MTDQEKREKVIEELSAVVADMQEEVDEWKDYSDSELRGGLTCDCDWWYNALQSVKDALALLKAQEPRVMTLEEMQKLQRNDVVWLDERAGKQVIPVLVRSHYIWPYSTVMVIDFLDSHGCTITVSEVDLLFRDRCWTSRPTDEQREATAWN